MTRRNVSGHGGPGAGKAGVLAAPAGTLAAALVLAAAAVLGGCGGSPKALGPYTPLAEAQRNPLLAQKLTQEAAALMDSDPEGAERLLREALTADLYHGPAHNNLGVLFLLRGELFLAAGEFEWARKLMPGHPDPRMNLALTLERAGRIDEAIGTYRTALEVYPDHLPNMQALARAQLRHGRADEGTGRMLEEIALKSESERWREWARMQAIRLESRP